MSYGGRFALFVGLSALGHVLLARGMTRLPPPASPTLPRVVVRVELREAPAKAAPAPEPAVVEARQPAEPRTPRPPKEPRPRRRRLVATTPAPAEQAKPAESAAPAKGQGTPTFGVSMGSTSQGGKGPAVPVGNAGRGRPGAGGGGGRGAGPGAPAPLGVQDVTKLPLPRGQCSGRYTEAAREAGLEGTVVLDLVVGEDGRTREVVVVRSLGRGLTEAAVAAVKACRFSPGERNGRPVAVRVRGFKIRFFLDHTL
ncbi:MAG: TonB family protein [Deltaproteobacteria bacterium]|nr:TonB family protein [Deltaproteobacteria bacterium]